MEDGYRPAVPHDRRELRTRAVQAVLDGARKVHVARDYGISRQTLHNWVTRHRLGGPDALAARPAGRPRRSVLEPWQEGQVAEAIRKQPPWTVHPGASRWTKETVAVLVEQRFGVRLSAWQVDSHLRRWGFASHKEARRAFLDTRERRGGESWGQQSDRGGVARPVPGPDAPDVAHDVRVPEPLRPDRAVVAAIVRAGSRTAWPTAARAPFR